MSSALDALAVKVIALVDACIITDEGSALMKSARTSIRTVSSRVRRAPRILAITALVAAQLVAVFAAAPASIAAPRGSSATTIAEPADLLSGTTSLKGDGYTWQFSVGASSEGVGVIPLTFHIGIERSVGTSFELHSWSVSPAASGSFTVNSGGGATLKSGSSLEPVASVDVTFVPTKKTTDTACLFGSSTVYTGTLSGSVDLVTGTTPKNLTLSSKKVSFSTGTNTLTVGTCIPDNCSGAASWEEPSVPSGLPAGTVGAAGLGEYVSGKSESLTSVIKETKLSSPKGTLRTDGVTEPAPAPKFSAAAKTLSVSASGIVTGSGTLTGTKGTSESTACQISGKGKKYTERITSYTNAKLSAWKAFVAHTVLTGVLTASTKGVGGFVIYTLS